MDSVKIRPEQETDIAQIHAVNAAAFPTSAEAILVDNLRQSASPLISLVAEHNGKIIGHILFTPMTLPASATVKVMGLAPMAVLPENQRQGIGSTLIKAGLIACKDLGAGAVVVLGHPDYYPKFGFVPASHFGLRTEYDVPDEVFMALEVVLGALKGISGVVKYHGAFSKV
ncbi:MAG: N-acetyltransferase [Candidatus Aureabacteria bacterium]|nr:N-acetyltransferase [Candidatus Auribacterota bacterium]